MSKEMEEIWQGISEIVVNYPILECQDCALAANDLPSSRESDRERLAETIEYNVSDRLLESGTGFSPTIVVKYHLNEENIHSV
jgi:hypothetical protein